MTLAARICAVMESNLREINILTRSSGVEDERMREKCWRREDGKESVKKGGRISIQFNVVESFRTTG